MLSHASSRKGYDLNVNKYHTVGHVSWSMQTKVPRWSQTLNSKSTSIGLVIKWIRRLLIISPRVEETSSYGQNTTTTLISLFPTSILNNGIGANRKIGKSKLNVLVTRLVTRWSSHQERYQRLFENSSHRQTAGSGGWGWLILRRSFSSLFWPIQTPKVRSYAQGPEVDSSIYVTRWHILVFRGLLHFLHVTLLPKMRHMVQFREV
jgi:hypothetical protein